MPALRTGASIRRVYIEGSGGNLTLTLSARDGRNWCPGDFLLAALWFATPAKADERVERPLFRGVDRSGRVPATTRSSQVAGLKPRRRCNSHRPDHGNTLWGGGKMGT
jgi:hypothetical protein